MTSASRLLRNRERALILRWGHVHDDQSRIAYTRVI